MRTWKMAIALLGVAAVCAPAFGADLARPGTVNYIEGAAIFERKHTEQPERRQRHDRMRATS